MAKLILVSHRLPVTIERKGNDFLINKSVGGLATGLSSVSNQYQYSWIGFPGIFSDELKDKEKENIKNELQSQNCYPVNLTEKENSLYYDGYSNKTLWPLFHYFQVYTAFDNTTWEGYKAVNEKFFNEVVKIADPEDIIWIHDYQLMLLPNLLKKKLPSCKIGFFLHIPFPSYELFRLLPNRKEILDGLLGSDLIGFHTYNYCRHFLSSVLRISGYEDTYGELFINDRVIKVDVFPMGIDFQKFSNLNNSTIKKETKIIQHQTKNQKIILSVDRLDFTKGLVQRLEAFDAFLTKYPEYQEKVTLIMVAVPTRLNVDLYHDLKNTIDKLVGQINGKYSRIGWIPIIYFFRSISFEALMAFYSLSDIALVTPLRDGMNLIAKEYIAAKTNKKGVLIISEMAGVAEELGEAIVINPNNKVEMIESIYTALNMSTEDQSKKIKLMQERLKRNDIFQWAKNFISRLTYTYNIQEHLKVKILSQEIKKMLLMEFSQAKNALFLLDYDGTLTGFKGNPQEAKPDKDVLLLLDKLSQNPKVTVCIISGRDKVTLEKWFAGYKLIIIAEHGSWMKLYDNVWVQIVNCNNSWKKQFRPILETFVDRTPKTFIEEKDYSLTWHYRMADPEFASLRSMELKSTLLHMISNLNLSILEGNKVLEIKNSEVSKGAASLKILGQNQFDFILSIGDDVTDEEMFSILPENAYSIKVGYFASKAKYNLESFSDVRSLLNEIGEMNE